MRNGPSVERFEEEIQELIDQGAEKGVITPGEGEMIQSIFELGETVAREIMVPRTSVTAAPRGSTIGQIIELLLKNGHSRLPIFDGDIDHIVGVLHAKELLALWGRSPDESLPEELIRPPIFFPESKKVVDLMTEVRTKKSHLAIILDEYGGTAGLVTLEDIIEEIIGDIHDEYDVEEEPITRVDDNTFLVDARVNIEDLSDYIGVDLPEGEYETVGGFISDLVGRVPSENEQVEFRDLLMTIRSADERKISQVEIRLQTRGSGLHTNSA
ncbi:MAG: hemolysin family protein [Pseudomonadota bacterium]